MKEFWLPYHAIKDCMRGLACGNLGGYLLSEVS